MSKCLINAEWPRVGFGITNTNGKSSVIPGWHEVPLGTTREQIEFTGKKPEPVKAPEPKQTVSKEWTVQGSRGAQYKVTLKNDRWDCTCPARQFRRGDCKHIKAQKNEAAELC